MAELEWDGGEIVMPFGRYRGKRVKDLPIDYLEYHVGPNPDKKKKQIKQPLYREAFLGELERRKLKAKDASTDRNGKEPAQGDKSEG